jgi:hypothetical protein
MTADRRLPAGPAISHAVARARATFRIGGEFCREAITSTLLVEHPDEF